MDNLDKYSDPKVHDVIPRMFKHNSIGEIKRYIEENFEEIKNASSVSQRNMLACWAAENNRKDVLKYLFEKDLMKNDDVIKKWISHTTKLTSDERNSMNRFLDSLESDPNDFSKDEPNLFNTNTNESSRIKNFKDFKS